MDALKIAEAVAKAKPETGAELGKVIGEVLGENAPDFWNLTLWEAVALFGSIKIGDLLRALTSTC